MVNNMIKNVLLALTLGTCIYPLSALAENQDPLINTVKQEESSLQARIGFAVFDAKDNSMRNYRGNERFPINSTHKVLSCAALLANVDHGHSTLGDKVSFDQSKLVDYSPVTKDRIQPKTMTLGELCAAAVIYSDNTAANLVFDHIGGPQGLTTFLREMNDLVTRSDRTEPTLNEAVPGDLRDTSTPISMSHTIAKLVLGDTLSATSKTQLGQWMKDDKVADALLRSVLPAGWIIGDKTGAGGYGSRSIVAVVWPPKRQPLVISIYITQTKASMARSNQAIARIGSAIFSQYH